MKTLAEIFKFLFYLLKGEKDDVDVPTYSPPKKETKPKEVKVEEQYKEAEFEEDIHIEEVESVEEIGLKKDKMNSVINAFENSSKERNYTSVFTWNDGPNEKKQITLSVGFTQAGNLQKVIQDYISNDGKHADELKKYNWSDYSLAYNSRAIQALKEACKDPIMMKSQDKIFDEMYWIPAKRFFDRNGFTENLSMLVIFDSYLHSGSVPSWLRDDFKERPPAAGGRERVWINDYVNARHNWLWNKGGQLRTSSYRTRCFKEQIKNENWNLDKPINANGVIIA